MMIVAGLARSVNQIELGVGISIFFNSLPRLSSIGIDKLAESSIMGIVNSSMRAQPAVRSA